MPLGLLRIFASVCLNGVIERSSFFGGNVVC